MSAEVVGRIIKIPQLHLTKLALNAGMALLDTHTHTKHNLCVY